MHRHGKDSFSSGASIGRQRPNPKGSSMDSILEAFSRFA
jgi:hypothetical protein